MNFVFCFELTKGVTNTENFALCPRSVVKVNSPASPITNSEISCHSHWGKQNHGNGKEGQASCRSHMIWTIQICYCFDELIVSPHQFAFQCRLSIYIYIGLVMYWSYRRTHITWNKPRRTRRPAFTV